MTRGKPDALTAAQQALDAAEKRRSALEREHGAARDEAIQREQARLLGQLQGRPAVYAAGAVIVQDDRVAQLRRKLQAATVDVNEARANYTRLYNLHLTRPGGSSCLTISTTQPSRN